MDVMLFGIMFAILAGLLVFQQRTIDRLTNKLMAKDYKEYVYVNSAEDKQEKRKRPPMSWHDDADIEIQDGD